MGILNSDDRFYKELAYHLGKKYKIKPYIFADRPSVDDPFGLDIKIKWTLGTRDFVIAISKNDLGPARVKDFLRVFNNKFISKYPELLL